MNDLLKQMEGDFEKNLSSNIEKVDSGKLKNVASIARQIRDEEEYIASLDKDLKKAKKNLLKLTDEELPTLLQEMGLSEFKLDDGSQVTIKQTYGASILVDNRPTAYQWLRDNGYGDLIKNIVSCEFGMGEDQKAEDFRDTAKQKGFQVEQNTSVHPQTLKAFVKERCEKGEEFPMELFGAFIGHRAIIKKGSN